MSGRPYGLRGEQRSASGPKRRRLGRADGDLASMRRWRRRSRSNSDRSHRRARSNVGLMTPRKPLGPESARLDGGAAAGISEAAYVGTGEDQANQDSGRRTTRIYVRTLRLVIGIAISVMVFAFADVGIAIAFAIGFVCDWLLGREQSGN